MGRFVLSFDRRIWTPNLVLMASAIFMMRFGEGVLGGARINFFVDTLGLTGGQVLWLEGVRELPGLALMFIAAFTMRLPLSRRAAAAVLITGVGYVLYATVGSYSALLAVAVFASLGMHMWFPLRSALGMSLSTKDKAGLVLGTLGSVGALASLIGMGILALVARLVAGLPLRAYYVIGGVFVVIASVLISRLPKDLGSTAEEQPRMLLKRRYWLYYVLTFFEGSRKQVLHTFGMLVLVDSFDLKVWQISLILLVSSVINMLAGPPCRGAGRSLWRAQDGLAQLCGPGPVLSGICRHWERVGAGVPAALDQAHGDDGDGAVDVRLSHGAGRGTDADAVGRDQHQSRHVGGVAADRRGLAAVCRV